MIRPRSYIFIASLGVVFSMLGVVWMLSAQPQANENADALLDNGGKTQADNEAQTSQLRVWFEVSAEALAEYDATVFEHDEEISL